ncbi:MAG TPA: glycerophosphodiester phosphodiesterase family protein [Pyrinomonadaceae bacterium]|nr:glycerophosphodiester phosphodiesterase family protein [Pyrinomonadaceae bacterium]
MTATSAAEVIAHRGGNGERPGETMLAYHHAKSLGVDVLEMDVYLTRDGHLVLMHDKLVQGTTNGEGHVWEFTLAQIQELNAGYYWAAPDGTFPYQKDLSKLPPDLRTELRVPSLAEVFSEFGDMRMIVEMKPAKDSPAEALWNLIQKFDLTRKVQVASFWHSYITEFRNRSGGAVPTSTSWEEFGELLLGFHGFEKHPVRPTVADSPHWLLDAGRVDSLHEHGYEVQAWTVNKIADMDRMIALGVDGIITDYPCALLQRLQRRSQTCEILPE